MEWRLAPDYIVNNWTDELFALMVNKLTERKKRETDAVQSGNTDAQKVSDKELFGRMGVKIQKDDLKS